MDTGEGGESHAVTGVTGERGRREDLLLLERKEGVKREEKGGSGDGTSHAGGGEREGEEYRDMICVSFRRKSVESI